MDTPRTGDDNGGERGHITKIMLFSSMFISISILLSCMVLASLILILQKNEEDEKTYDYQVIQVDSSTNKVKFLGSGTIFEDINSDSWIASEDDKSIFLVSNFGTNEFVCNGNCYCEEDRRVTGTILGRGISVLLASISSVLAFNIAKDQLLNNCRRDFSESCTHGSIQAEIDDCHALLFESSSDDKSSESVDKSLSDDSQSRNSKGIYKCQGHCLPHYNHFGKHGFDKKVEAKCADLKLDGMVESVSVEKAIDEFIESSLSTFCIKSSWWTKNHHMPFDCVGKLDMKNKSITCKLFSISGGKR